MSDRTLILNEKKAAMKIDRMAWQIYENHSNSKKLVLAGISNRGYKLAGILSEKLLEISSLKVELVEIKINKRDPFKEEPEINCKPSDIKNQNVIIVDDVLNSGRTMLFATRPFMDIPLKSLSIAVLMNRSYRNYPVAAKYIGQSLSTTIQENIRVEFQKNGALKAYLE